MRSEPLSNSLDEDLVDALQTLAGEHPGFRPVHAKGIVCSGTFIATPQARQICRAHHFQGRAVPAVIRFSNASGDPRSDDRSADLRGMAVKLQPPGGQDTDIVALSIDRFAARSAEEFLEFLQVQLPDPATGRQDKARIDAFLAGHPAAQAFVTRSITAPPPASYARETYSALHAFLFIAEDGTVRFGRYRWEPEAGEVHLTREDAVKREPGFLRSELAQRLATGPAFFRLMLQLAAEGDPTDDATAVWPNNRPVVHLGRLQIEGISSTSQDDERQLLFDPSRVPDGIDLSMDPILLARPHAYALDFGRRNNARST